MTTTPRTARPRTATRMRAAWCLTALGALLATAACGPRAVSVGSPAANAMPTVTSAGSLVRAMHARYAGTWYRNLAFVQTSQYYDAQGKPSRTETWYEVGALPGRLRIDIGERARGNGTLYRADSAYTFQNGVLQGSQRARNPLMLLGFDVYALPPERTLRMLAEEGFDTTKFHMQAVAGTPYYVVGGALGDTASKQFWVEADRLLFWRLITPPRTASQAPTEIRFQKYVKHGGGWVAEEVDFLRNGQRFFFESYANVRTNLELDPALFEPRAWKTARWPF